MLSLCSIWWFQIIILKHGTRTKTELKLPGNIKWQYSRKEEVRHQKMSVFVGINNTQNASSYKRGRINN